MDLESRLRLPCDRDPKALHQAFCGQDMNVDHRIHRVDLAGSRQTNASRELIA